VDEATEIATLQFNLASATWNPNSKTSVRMQIREMKSRKQRKPKLLRSTEEF
jgi:hypothetical protein